LHSADRTTRAQWFLRFARRFRRRIVRRVPDGSLVALCGSLDPRYMLKALAHHHVTISRSETARYGHVFNLSQTPRHATRASGTACWTYRALARSSYRSIACRMERYCWAADPSTPARQLAPRLARIAPWMVPLVSGSLRFRSSNPPTRARWFTRSSRRSACCARRIVRRVLDGSLVSHGGPRVALVGSFDACSMVHSFLPAVRSLRSAHRSTRAQCFLRFARWIARQLDRWPARYAPWIVRRVPNGSLVAVGRSSDVCPMVPSCRTTVLSNA
jgi:hypothetical protein